MTQRIALITGGSRGLGKNAALKLAAKGVDVIFTYHNKQVEAEALVVEIEKLGRRAATLQLDAGNVRAFSGFADQLKDLLHSKWEAEHIDYVVNNAGMGIYGGFAETTEEQFDALMNVHLKGVFFLTQKLLPVIKDGGRILNISSGLARFSFPGYAAYATMKGAVETLTRYLAKELGPRGISANVLAPGAIETDFGGGQTRDNAQVNAMIAANTAMGRAGLPDDIGDAIAALLTSESNWITGQRIEASGGMML